VATGREHTPEQRFDLTSEARELVQNGAAASADPLAPSGEAADSVIAALTSRGNVDAIAPVGRMRNLKRGVLKVSHVFLRDQAAFNRLTVNALEELTARLDVAEARLAELDAERGAEHEPGREAQRSDPAPSGA
jgi:hypothetical protein